MKYFENIPTFKKLKIKKKKRKSPNSNNIDSYEEENDALIDEKIANLGIKRKNGVEIKLCPNCLLPSLEPTYNLSGWMSSESYKCTNPDCKYSGSFYLAIEAEKIEEFLSLREEIKSGVNKKTE